MKYIITEEDRCIDILELIEMDKLLSFHAHTLTLYAALCYQSNYRLLLFCKYNFCKKFQI